MPPAGSRPKDKNRYKKRYDSDPNQDILCFFPRRYQSPLDHLAGKVKADCFLRRAAEFFTLILETYLRRHSDDYIPLTVKAPNTPVWTRPLGDLVELPYAPRVSLLSRIRHFKPFFHGRFRFVDRYEPQAER